MLCFKIKVSYLLYYNVNRIIKKDSFKDTYNATWKCYCSFYFAKPIFCLPSILPRKCFRITSEHAAEDVFGPKQNLEINGLSWVKQFCHALFFCSSPFSFLLPRWTRECKWKLSLSKHGQGQNSESTKWSTALGKVWDHWWHKGTYCKLMCNTTLCVEHLKTIFITVESEKLTSPQLHFKTVFSFAFTSDLLWAVPMDWLFAAGLHPSAQLHLQYAIQNHSTPQTEAKKGNFEAIRTHWYSHS